MADLAPEERDDYLRERDFEELVALTSRLHRPEQRAYRLLLLHGNQLAARQVFVPALDSLQAHRRVRSPAPARAAAADFHPLPVQGRGAAASQGGYYEGQLATYRRRGDAASMTACYHGLAGYYNSLGDQNQVTGYHLQAAEGYWAFRWNLHYDELAAAGQLYAEWGNLDKALYYLRQSLAGQGHQQK